MSAECFVRRESEKSKKNQEREKKKETETSLRPASLLLHHPSFPLFSLRGDLGLKPLQSPPPDAPRHAGSQKPTNRHTASSTWAAEVDRCFETPPEGEYRMIHWQSVWNRRETVVYWTLSGRWHQTAAPLKSFHIHAGGSTEALQGSEEMVFSLVSCGYEWELGNEKRFRNKTFLFFFFLNMNHFSPI